MFSINDILCATQGKLLQGNLSIKINSVSTDSRSIESGALFIAIKGENFDGHKFVLEVIKKGAFAVIVEKALPSIHLNIPIILVKNSIQALGQIAHFHRQRFSIPVIALTGSAGKTTTKDMIVQVLQSQYKVLSNKGTFNNHIGVPLTLLNLKSSHQVAVVECGTNQPGDIPWLAQILKPTIVVFINIGESHLERLRNLKGVFQEKRHLADFLDKKGLIIFNRDDPWLKKLTRFRRNVKKISFGCIEKADLQAKKIQHHPNLTLSFSVAGHSFTIKALGAENISNALAAICCGRHLGISYNEIIRALRNFKFNQGRQECLRVKNFFIVHDAYNANPVSVKGAINALNHISSVGRRIFICGDMLELGTKAKKLHEQMGELVAHSHIDIFLTFGELSRLMSTKAKSKRTNILVQHFTSMDALNLHLQEIIQPKDLIWIKGSRRMKMERAVEYLQKNLKG